jgi:undecaprenyl-diphosphatase
MEYSTIGWRESPRPRPVPPGGGWTAAGRTPRDAALRGAVSLVGGAAGLAGLLVLLIGLATTAGQAIQGPWRTSVERLDAALAFRLHASRCRLMDALMDAASWIGEREPIIVVTTGIVLYLLACRRPASAFCAAGAMMGTAVMWKVTSQLVHRPRPDYWLAHDPADLGYPGGHMMNAVVIAGACLSATLPHCRARWHRAGIILFWGVVVTATALCRVYVCAHFATDQLAGFLMGLAWVVVAFPLFRCILSGCRDCAVALGLPRLVSGSRRCPAGWRARPRSGGRRSAASRG